MTGRPPEPRLHPLLSTRVSPTAFDPGHEASSDDVASLLEAARWAPSAGNSQPWAFVTARRGDEVHRRLVGHLAPSSRRWAPAASILVVNLCHRYVEGTDWEYSEFSLYDLGQAVAHMTVQAADLGLAARQFRAFAADGLAAEFAVPPHQRVTTMTAFGRAADPDGDGDGEPRPARERRSREDLLWRS